MGHEPELIGYFLSVGIVRRRGCGRQGGREGGREGVGFLIIIFRAPGTRFCGPLSVCVCVCVCVCVYRTCSDVTRWRHVTLGRA